MRILDKRELRQEMKRKRDALEGEEIRYAGEQAARAVRKQPWFCEQNTIYLYAALGSELDTSAIFFLCQRQGKRVALPRVCSREDMIFYEVSDFSELSAGAFGILEPDGTSPVVQGQGLMFLPGLAFDARNNRLGYGGGYYDRYLHKQGLENLYTVGLCYDFQMVDCVPVGGFDLPLDRVLSIPVTVTG